MKRSRSQNEPGKCILSVLAIPMLASCATHCGVLNYCDIPNDWPLQDTFTVEANDNLLCVSGARRSSCASKGVFQSGTRSVEIHKIVDDDEHKDNELLASLVITGGPGEQFTASCYDYNGDTVLGFTEVLIGVEIRDRSGTVVAEYPTHPVARRGGLVIGC